LLKIELCGFGVSSKWIVVKSRVADYLPPVVLDYLDFRSRSRILWSNPPDAAKK
jgi:hypothetical protein